MKELSTAKLAALAKAQQASQAALKDSAQGPRARGQKRAMEALVWIHRWGWSTPTLLEMLTGKLRSGLGNRLVKNGLLIKTPTPSGGINSTPSYLLTLSETGLSEAASTADIDFNYRLNSKIKTHQIIHDELIQRITITMLRRNIIYGYTTPNMLETPNEAGQKIPDAVWFINNKKSDAEEALAIELELTPKWGIDLEKAIERTIEFLGRGCNQVIYLFKSQQTLERYKAAFSEGSSYSIWEKEKGRTGRWLKVDEEVISSEIAEKVKFQMIAPWMTDPTIATP
jgi:hypothetical protein